MKVTYQNESPSGIRYGDEVVFKGETFLAYSDAERDQWGEWNILTPNGWKSFTDNDLVTISYAEDVNDMLTY